ncbi:uncharacterized protein LOC142336813 [Convolutriloba macropyga]|uniref:uncharacterized protein LOC142336813 n=1 Tax=Convolutriloba macropyga TaxID=536237 RepID=UPI003F520287
MLLPIKLSRIINLYFFVQTFFLQLILKHSFAAFNSKFVPEPSQNLTILNETNYQNALSVMSNLCLLQIRNSLDHCYLKNLDSFQLSPDFERRNLPKLEKIDKSLNSNLYNFSAETEENLSQITCLCTIAGHCFLDNPYKPKLIVIHWQELPKITHLKSQKMSVKKFIYDLSVKVSATVSRCNDSVIWTTVEEKNLFCQFYGAKLRQFPFFPRSEMRVAFQCFNISIEISKLNSTFQAIAAAKVVTETEWVASELQEVVHKQKWKWENFPNPRTNRSLCGRQNSSLLCDPDNILTYDEGLELVETLEMFPYNYICFCADARNCSDYPSGPKVHVAMINESAKTQSDIQTSVKYMANKVQLFLQYQLCDDVVLIFYSVKDKYLFVSLGRAIETKLTHKFTADLLDLVPEYVVRGQVTEALNMTMVALDQAFERYMKDRERYLLFIQILLVSLVIMTPFACLMGLSFTK